MSRFIGRFAGVSLAILALCAVHGPSQASGQGREVSGFGPIEHEERSNFSHIRIRRQGDVRTLLFVRDNGQEVGQTRLDLTQPHHLLVPYTQWMFVSYFFEPRPQTVLVVGLGGGAMVHFLRRHDPDVKVDVVEIDPAVVRLAKSHFDVKPADGVRVITADAFDYLAANQKQYDVIYMDAYLKPSEQTDATGAPRRLKTASFHETLQRSLAPEGVAVFNFNVHRHIRDDVGAVRRAFAQTYVFRVPNSDSVVVAADRSPERLSATALRRSGFELDQRFDANFSFRRLARSLTR